MRAVIVRKSVGVRERPMAQIDLGDRDVAVVRARQRAQHARVRLADCRGMRASLRCDIAGARRCRRQSEQREARGRDRGRARTRGRLPADPTALRLIWSEIIRRNSARPSLRREPADVLREPDHPDADVRLVGVADEIEEPFARRAIAGDLAPASRRFPVASLLRAERPGILLEMVDEQPGLGGVAAQDVMDEGEPLRFGQPVVGELADVAAEARMRIAAVDPAVTVIELGANSDSRRGLTLAARDFAGRRRLEVALEQRPRRHGRAAPSTKSHRAPARP